MGPFALWALTPYYALAKSTHALHSSRRSVLALLAGSAAITLVELYVFVNFIVAPAAPQGFTFLLVPFGQLLVASPFLLLAFVLRHHTTAG